MQPLYLKHGTEIFFKDEDFKLTIGSPAMATGGMGDTLAGMITSFVGQFDNLKRSGYECHIYT